MVESMMPEDSQAMFGSGTAGSVWKSMLAEKVAAEIARSGVIGIAKQVAAAEAAVQAAKPSVRPEGDNT
jgi:Rod binding domain-containing protein